MLRNRDRRLLAVLLVLPTLCFGVPALSRTPSTNIDRQTATLTPTDRTTADQLQQQGRQQYQASQWDAAIKSWQQARTLYQQGQNHQGEAIALTSLGAVYVRLERYQAAITVLSDFLPLATQIDDRQIEAQALGNLGIAYAALGNYARAIESQRAAGKLMFAIGDRQGLGQVLVNLGNAFEAVGDYDNATIAYQQSLKIARQMGDPVSEGTALGNLGTVYSDRGQYDDAIAMQQRSLEIAESIGNREGQASALINLGTVYHVRGDRTRAVTLYQKSLTIAQQIDSRRQIVEALGSLGLAYEDLKDYPRSIDYYQKSLAIVQTLHDPQLTGLTLNNLGHVLFSAGKLAAAEQRLRTAIALLDALRPGLGDTYKASIFDTQVYTYNLLQQILIAAQKPEAALEITEHGRARAFVELLARRVQKPAVSGQEAGAKTQKPADAATSPNNQSLTGNSQPLAVSPITIDAIKRVAQQQNATLVEYGIVPDDDFKVQGKQRARESELFIWVVQPTGTVAFRRVDLKPLWQKDATLADVVRVARCLTPGDNCGGLTQKIRGLGVVSASSASGTSQLPGTPATATDTATSKRTIGQHVRLYPGLRKLHQLLIDPIADLLPRNPSDRIIFIPQESLFLVPFVALQDADGSYLIQHHTILTAPAIQVLELTRQQREKGSAGIAAHSLPLTPAAALIVGNPTMPSVVTDPGQPPEPLAPLPGAEKEAIAIAQLLGTQAITGAQATKVSILKKLPTARLVHLATHGLLEYGGQNTSLEGLGIPGAIALAPSDQDDGLLTTSEVLNLQLHADLVTLSACDTGQGRISGDGVVGLSRAFISAGVPSVIVSLWAVPDAATAKLMTTFYRTLQQHPDKAQALRQAMLTTLKDYPYPIDWAAFTLIGEAE